MKIVLNPTEPYRAKKHMECAWDLIWNAPAAEATRTYRTRDFVVVAERTEDGVSTREEAR